MLVYARRKLFISIKVVMKMKCHTTNQLFRFWLTPKSSGRFCWKQQHNSSKLKWKYRSRFVTHRRDQTIITKYAEINIKLGFEIYFNSQITNFHANERAFMVLRLKQSCWTQVRRVQKIYQLTRCSRASCRNPYNFSSSKSFYKSHKKNILYAMPRKTNQRNSIVSVHLKPLTW